MFLEGGWAASQPFKHPWRFPSGPPHGWVYQRRPRAGSFRWEQWLGDATEKQEEGPVGLGGGGGAEEAWLPKPDSPQPRGGLESRSRKRFLSNVSFLHIQRLGLVLRALLWVLSHLLSRILIRSNCRAVANEALWGSGHAVFVHLSYCNENIRAWWLNQQAFISHSSGSWEVQGHGNSRFGIW